MVNIRVINNVEYLTLEGKTYYMRDPTMISCRPHPQELLQVVKGARPVLTLQLTNHPNFRAVIHCADPPQISFYDEDDYLPPLPLDRYDYGGYHLARLSDGDIYVTVNNSSQSSVDRYLIGPTTIIRYNADNEVSDEWDSQGVDILLPERYQIRW